MNGERRAALVTGSAGGLGLAIAEELARLGNDVVIHGLQQQAEGDKVAAAIAETHGVKATYVHCDLTEPGAAAELARAAETAAGRIDILVNNAVTRHFAPVEAMADQAWERALAVNLTAPFGLIRALLPAMRRSNWGRIINVGSIYSLVGATNRIDYVTTKTALLGLTRAVALEVAGTDISCNAICPGTLQTPEIESRIERLATEQGVSVATATTDYLANRQPSGRYIDTAAVTRLVAMLCAPEGRDINGAAIPVDAGWSVS